MRSKVAIQGIQGSYSEQATHEIFDAEQELVECMSFDDAFSSVVRGDAEYAVVPVANTIAGEIKATLSLLQKTGLRVLKEETIPIQHVLVGTPDAEFERLKNVQSHVEALKQCRNFLTANPQLTQIGGTDTASSIRRVVTDGDPASSAIGSPRAAELYGAKILRAQIADDITNWTKFYLIGN